MLKEADKKVIEEAEKEGMSFLDSIDPDWFEYIDLKRFDIESGDLCVVGQCGPHLIDGMPEDNGFWSAYYEFEEYFEINMGKHGFELPPLITRWDFEYLNAAWKYLGELWTRDIAKRQGVELE